MKTERELYVLELSRFGVIDAVFSEINECVDFSCFDFCGLTKDDITFGYRIWLASKNREGYKLVPVNPTDEMINTYRDKSIAPISTLSVIGYKAMIGATDE